MPGLLIFSHCHANTGYAIAPLEQAFFAMAVNRPGVLPKSRGAPSTVGVPFEDAQIARDGWAAPERE